MCLLTTYAISHYLLPSPRRYLISEIIYSHIIILTRRSQVIILYILGYRMQAVSIVSREVVVPRGLVGIGLDTVDQSGGEIALV